jgi:cytochrome c-type biogenesis protein CcmE
MTRKGRRLTLIAVALAVVGVAAGLALYALRDNIVFFYSPSDIVEKRFLGRQRVREFAFAETADLQDHRRLGQS